MTVLVEGAVIRLDGRCRLEEAEALLDALLRIERPEIDLLGCTAMHMALVQILLACPASIAGPPDNPFIARYIWPLLAARMPASVAVRAPL